MPDLRVSSEAVAAASSGVADMVAEFDARHTAANQTVSALVSSSWTGPASTVFQTGWVQWSDGAAKVSQALEGISRLLSEASVQYAETESAVTRTSASSSVQSGGTPSGAGSSGGSPSAAGPSGGGR